MLTTVMACQVEELQSTRVVGFQMAKFEVGAVGKHHCEHEGLAANPCGAASTFPISWLSRESHPADPTRATLSSEIATVSASL